MARLAAAVRWYLLGLAGACAVAACSPAPDAAPPVGAPSGPASSRPPAADPPGAAAPHGRATRPAAPVAPISARARAAGLRDIRAIVPDAVVDLRYATTDNFTQVRLYPVHARCLVHRSMAKGLRTAAARLRRHGFVLVFWDCYRPHAVQVRMFRIVPDPNWVARPGPYATSHESGRSVDVTLARASRAARCAAVRRVHGHCLARMGTDFDDFTARAHAYAKRGVGAAAEADRARLRRAMAAGGITVYAGEWWHFDGPGAKTPRPHLHAPVR